MNRLAAFLSLFSSTGTLVCCALPALFVALGAGATFASLIGQFPQLIWLSEHKVSLFVFAGTMLAVSGFLQWRARKLACPVDAKEACETTRDWSLWVYFGSVLIFAIGAGFAFLPQLFT
jgi:hypothetical protein